MAGGDIHLRFMHGAYISKAECLAHSEEIQRVMDAYPKAMAAMEAHERLMERCVCDWSCSDEQRAVNIPPETGCPVHAPDEDDV